MGNGSARVRFNGQIITVDPGSQYDLTQATIFGLNERLTSSSNSPLLDFKNNISLRELFNKEWEKYQRALSASNGPRIDYGVYAYYPYPNHLVKYCDSFWHRVVAVASSSKLITDPGGKLSWWQIRNIFEQTTVGVAGGSVGNNVLHALVMDMRPQNIKIADKSSFKMENINRVRLTYNQLVEANSARSGNFETLLCNKADVAAGQIYSIDPFINVHAYPQGLTSQTTGRFFEGAGSEPPVDIVVDEVDDPRIKLELRQRARARKLPLLMATDIGSCIQLDVLRYDQRAREPLSYGISDKKLLQVMEEVYKNPGDRGAFFSFVDALIGPHYRQGELARIVRGQGEIPTATLIPQLGSTAAVAGGILAEAVCRVRLGHKYPPRTLINKHTFQVISFP